MAETLNTILSLGTIVLAGFSIKIIYFIISKKQHFVFDFVKNNSLTLIVLISGGASIGSLIYSGIIGYEPCVLCWWQRIGIFGAFVVSATALVSRKIKTPSLFSSIQSLSIFGLLFAIYHNFIYYTGNSPLPCGVEVSCTQHLVSGFGFISIPLMSLVVLITISLLAFVGERTSK